MSTTVRGAAELAAELAAGIRAAIPAALEACAAVTQDRLAVYPPAPPTGGRRQWYERGYGPRWRRRDGSVGGRKTSQTMNRRWAIEPVSDVVVGLENGATYAPFVVGADDQAGRMAQIGWRNERDVVEELAANGTYTRIGDAAIRDLLK